jgi:Uma2 family endonuclease
MVAPSLLEPGALRPLKAEEFLRLAEAGAFVDEHVELLHGVVVRKMTQGPRHIWSVERLARRLRRALDDSYAVLAQSSLLALPHAVPEPDVAVVPDAVHGAMPTSASALLVIEVADSSLKRDDEIKRPIYAAAGVPEYWIVDLVADAVIVHTEPEGGDYRRVERVTLGAVLRPVRLPAVALVVDDELLGR